MRVQACLVEGLKRKLTYKVVVEHQAGRLGWQLDCSAVAQKWTDPAAEPAAAAAVVVVVVAVAVAAAADYSSGQRCFVFVQVAVGLPLTAQKGWPA